MVFLAVVLALGALQLAGEQGLGQRARVLAGRFSATALGAGLFIGVPSLAVAAVSLWLSDHIWPLAFPFAAAVLWFSIASATHKPAVEAFVNAGRANDWHAANTAYQSLAGESSLAEGDWQPLNTLMLQRAAYLGFSQFFAVLFWFCLLGPAAALIYRLTCLSTQQRAWPGLSKVLWYLEWPAARLLGFTFAFTGNFSRCIQTWRTWFFCGQRSSEEIITLYVLGALGVAQGSPQSSDVTRRELLALGRLLRRSLWFWVGSLAVAALVGW